MAKSIRLRPWQLAALDQQERSESTDFLAVATPGAGKTTFALAAARRSLARTPARLVVVVPTAHLKFQWARAAAALDLHLEAGWAPSHGAFPPDMHGIVTTYQQVASAPEAFAHRTAGAFVILDEIHHAGDDRAWGDALLTAFEGAGRRLSLSGTPFRSDTRSIPFVRYELDEARPDFEYGYGPALTERRVVRAIYFPRTNGHMEWSAPDGSVYAAGFDDALDTSRANQRLRAALSLEGEWLPDVLARADARLRMVREHHREAGGLVVATDQEHAHGIADLMRRRLRARVVVATSDDPEASRKILNFTDSGDQWLVAVRMVSEGVDIPRLRVGVFATTTTTELFFRQVVGRFVRWQPGVGRQSAHLFIPDDVRLRSAAFDIAADRRHSLRREGHAEQGDERFDDPDGGGFDDPGDLADGEQLSLFAVISAVATEAVMPDDELHDEPVDADLDPALILELPAPPLLPGGNRPAIGSAEGSETLMEQKARLRASNTSLARDLARWTGMTHAQVNGELNRLVGLQRIGDATADQLDRRLTHARRWMAKR
jgi:superfamily II DNA or RNA helicase